MMAVTLSHSRGVESRPPRRKVLVIEGEAAVRNLIRVLLESLGCECTLAPGIDRALAILKQRNFDAVVLDFRSSEGDPAQIVSGIREIRPSLIGRVLVINGEGADPHAVDLIGRHCFPTVSRNKILQQLWESLQKIFAPHGLANPAS